MNNKTMWFALAVCGAAAGGCKKDSKPTEPPTTKKVVDDYKPTTDALWKLAPEGATVGAVIAPGTFRTSLETASWFLALADRQSALKNDVAEMRAEIVKNAPFNLLDEASIQAAGIDLDAGAAYFGNPEPIVMVLPVSDRAAFRAAFRVTEVDGFDQLDKVFCKPVASVYACAKDKSKLDTVGKNTTLATRIGALPTRSRGDLELLMDIKGTPLESEFHELGPVIDAERLVFAARIGGGFSITGKLQGTLNPEAATALGSYPTGSNVFKAWNQATSVVRTRVPLSHPAISSTFPKENPPGMPIPFDLRKDLLDQLTGEFAMYTGPGQEKSPLGWLFAVGMKDTKVIAEKLPQLCGLMSLIPGVTAIAEDGRCTGSIDLSELPETDPALAKLGKITLAVVAEGDGIYVGVGAPVGKTGTLANNASTPLMKSIAGGTSDFTTWYRWVDPLVQGPLADIASQALSGLDNRARAGVALARAVMARVYDGGISIKAGKGGIEFTMAIATVGHDKGVDAAYDAAVHKLVSGDRVGYQAGLAEIAKKHPDSLAAKIHNTDGSVAAAAAAPLGIAAAVAIPAFLKYIEKSKAAATDRAEVTVDFGAKQAPQ